MYAERDDKKRQQFVAEISRFSPDRLVYIDESGIDKFLSREYGWGLKGEKVFGEISGRHYARESFVAGLNGNKIIAPFCYTGTCNTTLFNFWLENFLLPAIGPDYILIMDNATFHKSEETRSLIANAKCELFFLPPYSPDLNPIEICWANLKNRIKKVIAQFSSLSDAIDFVFQTDHLKIK